MNILIPDSWLREYLQTDAAPKDIQKALSLCGPSVERLHPLNSDFIYDIEVTTNRVDCMSIYGIAREAAAILPRFGHTTRLLSDPFALQPSFKTSSSVDYLSVKTDPRLCRRFSALLIENVSAAGPSPDWLVQRLEAVGMRSLNPVVDISNYLMHELGQPVHTFDYDKISHHALTLRESHAGETLTTLDGKDHSLPGHDIVIEDGNHRLIDLCGIMGGLNSAVDATTKNVLLFVQTYEPAHIRKTSMALAHRTAAAVLFEKDLPTDSVLPTLEKGLQLFKSLTSGQPRPVAIDIVTKSSPPQKITASPDFINSRLGISLSASEISSILESLGFTPHAPWWRQRDINIPEDIVEEVARIYGYHHLPSRLMPGDLPTARANDAEFFWINRLKSALKFWGFTETYTYSLTSQGPGLQLANPLSQDWLYLRTSLVPSLRAVVADNLGKASELNLFEIAHVYLPRPHQLPKEALHLCLCTTRPDPSRLKGLVTALLNHELGLTLDLNANKLFTTFPDCLAFEIDLSRLLPQAQSLKKFTPISPYPPVIEDLNVTLNRPYPEIQKRIFAASTLIKNVELVDKYDSKLTLRITYHSNSRQLSSADIAPVRQKLTRLQSS